MIWVIILLAILIGVFIGVSLFIACLLVDVTVSLDEIKKYIKW